MKLAILFLAPLLAAGQKSSEAPADDLARLQSEPNLEKRAHAALNNAEDALKQARDAYTSGDTSAAESRLEEVGQSVELADSTLKQTGKNPSRSPKHFKYAELRTRDHAPVGGPDRDPRDGLETRRARDAVGAHRPRPQG